MIDFKNSGENKQHKDIDYRVTDFQCENCGNIPDIFQICESVATYGFVYLVGKENSWLGLNCPLCEKYWLNIRKFKNKEIKTFINEEIKLTMMDWIEISEIDYLESSNIIVYHSFPFDHLCHPLMEVPFSNHEFTLPKNELDGILNTLPIWQRDLENDNGPVFLGEKLYFPKKYKEEILDPEIKKIPNLLETSYLSYDIESTVMGQFVSICSYKDEEIKKLAASESNTGLKVFPRYIVYEPLFTEIESFCWLYQIKSGEIRSTESVLKESLISGSPNPVFDPTLKKNLKDLKKTVSQYLNISPSPKKTITKSFDFMRLLDWPPEPTQPPDAAEIASGIECLNKKDQWIMIHATNGPDLHYQLRGIEPEKKLLGFLGDDHENFSETIWSNFLEKNVQDLLGKLADKFIDEYIELSKRISLTPKTAWNLKEKYLMDLAGFIESRTKRKKINKEIKNHERKRVREAEEKYFPSVKIISDDSKINDIKVNISKLSKLDADTLSNLTILLLGERGTGKDLFAQAVHYASGQKGEMVVLDCGASDESLFGSKLFGHKKGAFTGAVNDKKGALEKAINGTLFIDEVGNLPKTLQQKFLRVLQNREFQPLGAEKTIPVKALVVLATNKDLDTMTKKGDFMPDLYDRFKRPAFTIPPLRERKDDLPLLIDHFIDIFDKSRKDDPALDKLTITSDCLERLSEHDWPGNVRELERVIHEIIMKRIMNDDRSPIDLTDLPDLMIGESKAKSKGPKKPKNLPGNTKITDDQVRYWMEKLGSNKTHVGKKLDVSYYTILRRCKKLGL